MATMGQVDVKTAMKYPASRSGYCAHGVERDGLKLAQKPAGRRIRLRHTLGTVRWGEPLR